MRFIGGIRLVFYYCFVFALGGCSSDLPKRNRIVLVFNNWNDEGPLTTQVKYIDDYLISHFFVPGEFGRDKCVIPTSREYVDFSYHSRGTITNNFLFKNGDSVLIEMKGEYPIVTVLNRDVSEYESNFESCLNRRIYNGQPSALEQYHFYWSTANSDMSPISGAAIFDELAFLKKKALHQITIERRYIDSLADAGIIGREIADYYKLKNAYMRDQLELFESDTLDIFNRNSIERILSRIIIGSEDSVNYIPSFYDELITLYYDMVLSVQIDRRRYILDSLSQLEYYSSLFGRSLLFKHADRLLSSASVDEGRKLLRSFEGDTLLEHWSNFFSSKYHLDQNFDSGWRISRNQDDARTFNSLLQESRGSLLYIDLWASWCYRGLKEMPALRRLHHDYRLRGVNIVHISADTDVEKWKWAEDKYLDYNESDSYMLYDLDVSRVVETFGGSIPRYLLFDHNGMLLHGNAPTPSSEEIRILFDKYISIVGNDSDK